jgi:hypothetical protein
VPLYSGLSCTPIAINNVTVILVIYQLTMTGTFSTISPPIPAHPRGCSPSLLSFFSHPIGLFGLKKFTGGAITAAVFAGLTILFRIYIGYRWGRSSTFLPLQLCPRTSNVVRGERRDADNIHTYYIDPAALLPPTIDEAKANIAPELEQIKKDDEEKHQKKAVKK